MRRLGSLMLLILVLVGGTRPAVAQFPPDFVGRNTPAMHPDHVDILEIAPVMGPYYRLYVTLAVSDAVVTLSGSESVYVTNTSADTWEDSVVFRLYPNLPSYGGSLVITRASIASESLTPTLDETGTILDVPLIEAIPPGFGVTIDLAFETTLIPGMEALYNQFSYLDGVLAAPNFFPLLSVYEADEGGWWRETAHPRGDAVYSETANFDVTLTAPQDLVIATSGVTVAETPGDDNTIRYEIVAPLMRDFALMASDRFTVQSGTVDGVKVNVYSYEGDELMTDSRIIATDAMHVFNTAFGQYPFAEVDVVETPTSAGGIEYPGLVVIAEQRWHSTSLVLMNVIVHEIAHEWWYSLVGNDQTRDPWLDEALAQYSVAIFFQDMLGEASYQAVLNYYETTLQPLVVLRDILPIGLPVADYATGDLYSAIVYNKGPLFFAALADLAGQDALREMLREYFGDYCYKVVEPADMLASFEATSGRDLDDVFRQWVGEFPGLE